MLEKKKGFEDNSFAMEVIQAVFSDSHTGAQHPFFKKSAQLYTARGQTFDRYNNGNWGMSFLMICQKKYQCIL